MADDWLDEERDLHSLRRELDRLKRRARARLFRTLLLAVLMTAAMVYIVARRVPLAESRVLIRVTEGDVLRDDSPKTSRDLDHYLRDSAFSNRNLLQVIHKHGLYPLERMRGDMYALEEMREHLILEVYRNYFLEARGYNGELRTARISVRFLDEDPVVSFAVCSDLARLVIDSEARRRQESGRGVAGVTQRALDSAAAGLAKREKELAVAQAALRLAERANRREEIAALKVEISRLMEEVKDHAKLVASARQSKSRADLQLALESRHINVLYEIVDERAPPPPPVSPEIRLAMIALACFLILLPLCAIAVGAFDSRIHDLEDVQRLGLEVVGHVPRFAGFGIGTMRSRRPPEHRRT